MCPGKCLMCAHSCIRDQRYTTSTPTIRIWFDNRSWDHLSIQMGHKDLYHDGWYITFKQNYFLFRCGHLISPQFYEADYWWNETTIIHITLYSYMYPITSQAVDVHDKVITQWVCHELGHGPHTCAHGCHINVLRTLAVQWGLDKMYTYKWHLLSDEESMPVSPPPAASELCVCV